MVRNGFRPSTVGCPCSLSTWTAGAGAPPQGDLSLGRGFGDSAHSAGGLGSNGQRFGAFKFLPRRNPDREPSNKPQVVSPTAMEHSFQLLGKQVQTVGRPPPPRKSVASIFGLAMSHPLGAPVGRFQPDLGCRFLGSFGDSGSQCLLGGLQGPHLTTHLSFDLDSIFPLGWHQLFWAQLRVSFWKHRDLCMEAPQVGYDCRCKRPFLAPWPRSFFHV